MMTIPESDWKRFKKLRAVALERFAQQALDDSQAICAKESKSAHKRYLELYALIRDRDREIERMFNDFRRSTAILTLKLMCDSKLITDEELSEFSAEVRGVLGRM